MKVPYIPKQPLKTCEGNYFPYSSSLVDAFTLKSRFGETVELFRVKKDKIVVPIQCSLVSERDFRVWSSSVSFEDNFIPRDEIQEGIVSRSLDLLQHGDSHIIKAGTGLGKTWMATAIAGRLGKPFLVIVPKADLIQHWLDAFQAVLGLHDNEYGVIQGDRYEVPGRKAVVGMVHSLCKPGRYPDWVYRYFSLVIVDEVHTISATTFHEAMWLLPSKLRLGLSATPRRADGKDFIFHAHIGSVKVKADVLNLTPRVVVKKCGYIIPTRKVPVTVNGKIEWHDMKDYTKPGRTMGLNVALAKSEVRNRMIAGFVKEAYDAGRTTIIFSDSRKEHLPNLESELIGAGVNPHHIGWYVGGLSEEEREIAKHKKVILSTYRMASLGTDIPWLDTCVLATPRSDVVQIVGRILRKYKDKKRPVVFDIVDTDCNMFVLYFHKRLAWYKSIKADVVTVD